MPKGIRIKCEKDAGKGMVFCAIVIRRTCIALFDLRKMIKSELVNFAPF